jgi:ubiquinone/menaquinone biosynthesis C-methylase UbiE
MAWIWVVVGLSMLLAAGLLYWAFVITEGAYLGARTVAWTYDLAARRYDDIKQFNRRDDIWFLIQPMLLATQNVDCPLILDLATGTGRVPDALLYTAPFDGTVVAQDLSRKMLLQAQHKLAAYRDRYMMVRRDAQQLPYPDESFDAVCCLEALEFMPSPQRVLEEMTRVLRPGGLLLITNRVNWESKLMPGKAFGRDELQQMLAEIDLPRVEIRPWQVYYDLVWARKAGIPSRLGRGTAQLETLLRCPHCSHPLLPSDSRRISCSHCDREYPIYNGIHDLEQSISKPS